MFCKPNTLVLRSVAMALSVLAVGAFFNGSQLFAQDPGSTNWKDRYVTLASQNDRNPQLARPDTNAFVVVVWERFNGNNWDIWAQKIETEHGLPLWAGDGIPVCTHSGDQRNPRAAYDQGGGVIVTWEDQRGDTSRIYAHRIVVSTGLLDSQWSSNPDGVPVCSGTGGTALRPRIVGTGDGAFIAWTYLKGNKKDARVQYLDSYDGSPRWTANGIPASADTSDWQINPELCLDKPPQSGTVPGIIVAWEELYKDNWQIFAQRLNSSGSTQWGGDLRIAETSASQHYHQIESDASVTSGTPDGPVITWVDWRNGNPDIYCQQVSYGGVKQWTSGSGDGLEVCVQDSVQKNPRLRFRGKAVIAWEDERNASDTSDVYAALVDVASDQVITTSPWSSTGRAVSTASYDQKNIALSMYNVESTVYAVIGWQDEREPSNINIFLQQFASSDSYNSYIWQSNGWQVTYANDKQSVPQLS